jgi:hypothetical protein
MGGADIECIGGANEEQRNNNNTHLDANEEEQTVYEDDVLEEQRRERSISTFLSLRRAKIQRLQEYDLDHRGLRVPNSARQFRLFTTTAEDVGRQSADLGLFFETVLALGKLCVVIACLTLHEVISNVERAKMSAAYVVKVSDLSNARVVETECYKSYYGERANFVLTTTPGSECADAKARSFFNCPTKCTYIAKDDASFDAVIDNNNNNNNNTTCDLVLPCRFKDENDENEACCEEAASDDLKQKSPLNVGVFVVEFLVVLVCTIFDAAYQKMQSNKFLKYDAETMTVGDYSVLVRGVDKDATREDVAKFFTHYGEVANVCLMKNVFRLVEAERKLCNLRLRRAEIAAELNEAVVLNHIKSNLGGVKRKIGKFLYRIIVLKGTKATKYNVAKIDKLILDAKESIREIERSNKLKKNTGQAIVTFNYEISASACVADHVSDFEEWFFRKLRREADPPKMNAKQTIRVERAPEPSDILYRNQGFNRYQKHQSIFDYRNRHVHAFFIMTGSLVIFCLLQWFAERWRTQIRLDIIKRTALTGGDISISDRDQNVLQVLKITSALTIAIINVILTQIAKAVNEYERFKTNSMANTMLLGKLVLVHALNVCAIPIFVTPCGKNDGDCEYYTAGGLVDQAFYLQLFNIFTPHLMVFLQLIVSPGYFTRNFLAPFAKTQSTLDWLYSPPEFALAEQYAQACKTFAMANLYGQALPIGYALAVAALFTQYWANMYSVLRVCRKPAKLCMMSTYMVSSVIKFTTLANILFGYFFFYRTSTDSSLGVARLWTCLAIWLCEAILPTRFVLGIGKYAERLDKIAKGKKFFKQRGTYGQPYVSLLCMDEEKSTLASSTSTSRDLPRRNFLQSALGSFAFSTSATSAKDKDKEHDEVESIINEAGVELEEEMMDEIDTIASKEEEDAPIVVVAENVAKNDPEEEDIDEHEKRYKRNPTTLTQKSSINRLEKKRRAVAKILLDMEKAQISQYAPDALATIPNLSRDDFARYLNFLSSISRCSVETLAHSARLEMYHPPVPNELNEDLLVSIFVKEYALFETVLDGNQELLPGQRPWSGCAKTMPLVMNNKSLPDIDWKIQMLARYKESMLRSQGSWRQRDP